MKVAVLLVALLAAPSLAHADYFDYSTDSDHDFKLWVPDGGDVVYGLYVILNESSGDTRTLIDREAYQAWAQSFGFGLVGTRFSDIDEMRATKPSTYVLDAIDELATLSSHPELSNAPLVVEGLSMGGYMTMEFVDSHPERVIATLSGGSLNDIKMFAKAKSNKTPQLYYLGEMDSNINDANYRRDELLDIRQDSGAQLAFWTQWNAEHERGDALELGWKMMGDCVALRYPQGVSPANGPVTLLDIPEASGWVADQTTWDSGYTEIFAQADFSGQPHSVFWLPTKDAAFAYRAHSSHNSIVHVTTPDNPEVFNNFELLDPDDSLTVEVVVQDPPAAVEKVEFFDGSQPIGEDTTEPYSVTWTAQGVGAHEIVSVATLTGGGHATGIPYPVIVRGKQAPGGGTIMPQPDAGVGILSDAGLSDANAVIGDGANPTKPSNMESGCGCQGADLPQTGFFVALTILFAIARPRSKRRHSIA